MERFNIENIEQNIKIASLHECIEPKSIHDDCDMGEFQPLCSSCENVEFQQESKEILESGIQNFEKCEFITDLEMTEGIASYLENIEDLHYERWCKLSLEERTNLLNQIEDKIALIEHRPPLAVEVIEMDPKTLGYQDSTNNKIALNSLYVSSNDPALHREVVDTIIHEGRHAYQHYNVDVKTIHESWSEVQSWKENFYDPNYKYYTSTGTWVLIPFNDGSIHNVDFRLYYYQPVEIDARDFAADVMRKLEGKGMFG